MQKLTKTIKITNKNYKPTKEIGQISWNIRFIASNKIVAKGLLDGIELIVRFERNTYNVRDYQLKSDELADYQQVIMTEENHRDLMDFKRTIRMIVRELSVMDMSFDHRWIVSINFGGHFKCIPTKNLGAKDLERYLSKKWSTLLGDLSQYLCNYVNQIPISSELAILL